MEIKLSPRLQKCCEYVRPGAVTADIGCDHGYTSIHLLKKGIAKKAYACDVKEGPLQSAVINAHKYGVEKKVQFFLSDGLKNVPRDFDTCIIAGMGADVMVSILSAAPWLKSEQYHLILQCQSKTPTLRKYLSDEGWCIREEAVVADGRFLYTVMDLSRKPAPLTAAQTYFPPALYGKEDENVRKYYRHVVKNLTLAAQGQQDEALFAILKELDETLPKWVKEDAT